MAQVEVKAPEKKVRMKRSMIDCDVHHLAPVSAVKDHLPRFYRDQIDLWGWRLPGPIYLNGGVQGLTVDSTPPDGTNPLGGRGDLEYLRSQHLDPFNVEYGILTGSDYSFQASPDPDYAAAICSALNDYTIEHWTSKDKRLKASLFIAKQDPLLAAKEIDRIGSHPDMVQVIVANGAEKPYGNRFYHPIYEACVRHNLPFNIHVLTEGLGINNGPTGAGYVTYYPEYRAARPQVMMAHLASFIFEGVFEKFPTLKVVLQEAGAFWVAPFLWKLDSDWKSLRFQTPWVKKAPSEYFRSNIRVTSQPLELPPTTELLQQMMKAIYADECLMFCSDFPHWDFDSPLLTFPKLDDALWERIFYQNAADLYELPARRSEQGGAQV